MKDIVPLTKQEIFDRACKGLEAQGFKRSFQHENLSSSGVCGYRGYRGRKCAIGHCLEDSDLNGYEGPIGRLPEAARIRLGLRAPADFKSQNDGYAGPERARYSFLQELQESHDFSSSPKIMKDSLIHFGKRNNLDTSLIEKAKVE